MKLYYLKKVALSCALGIATILAPAVPAAQAMPMARADIKAEQSVDVQKVWHRGHRHYPRRWHHRRHYRPGFGFYVGPRYGYRERYVRRGGSAHVSWCLSRYRSYNPATNRFLSYGGVYKVCHSPYR